MSTEQEKLSPAEIAETPKEGGMDILSFLKEKRPTKEIKETSPEQVGLIESLKIKVGEYKKKLEDSGANKEAIQSLATEYALDLRKTQQDPRKYIDLGNRTYATDRLNEEITDLIPDDRELTLEDLDRAWRLDHDLDEFKTVNDMYGHQAGDRVLNAYSEILKTGEAAQWLKNTGLLAERAENEAQAFESTVEGGEEFGGLIIFKEDFKPLALENGAELSSQEQVVQEFIKRIQQETQAKFKDLLSQKKSDGSPKYPIIGDIPEGVELPDNFVMDSGTSFGYSSLREAAENTTIFDDDDYDTVLQKMRSNLFEKSDGRAINNKLDRKITREQSADDNARLTAEISPRGRAEMLERQNKQLAEQSETAQEKVRSAESTITALEGQLSGLESALTAIEQQEGFEVVKDQLVQQIESMKATISSFRQ